MPLSSLAGQTSEPTAALPAAQPVAVIDIGSNSSRVVVLRQDAAGHLQVLADAHAPLRLVSELDARGRFSPKVVEAVVRTLGDFRTVAAGAGASSIIAVATAAVREAANGADLVARIHRDAGIAVRVITGEEEARYAFLGAIHGLPVDHGMLMDMGGGSMQIIHFRDRKMLRVWMLPLGALRLSGRFLSSNPPAPAEIRRLLDYVRGMLAEAGLPKLRRDEHLIGTGGTLRNLGKIDRRSHTYPLSRLHGYVLARRRLKDIAALLARRNAAERAQVPGLNKDRVDSITGGALAALAVAETVSASAIQIAGEGLREGLALAAAGKELLPADAVRRMSLAALCARFATWEAAPAARRSALAQTILTTLDPAATAEQRETLTSAAAVLDTGRSIDYYSRFEHTAQIVATTDLAGFAPRAIALLAATVLLAGEPGRDLKGFAPLLGNKDALPVQRMAAVLALADALDHRYPPGPYELPHCERRGDGFVITTPVAQTFNCKAECERIRKYFGYTVTLEPASPARRS